jgi:hypothetical protein
MNTYSPNVYFRQFTISELSRSTNYQRDISETFVEEKVRDFDVNLLNVVKVSRRDGKLFILDGQHTVTIISRKSGSDDTPVWCMVYSDLTEQEEARLYALQGGRRLTLVDKHKAKIVAEDEAALDVEDVLDEVGLRISKAQVDGGVCAVKALQDAYAVLGKAGLKRVLSVIANTWDGAGVSLQSGIINGVRQLYEAYGNDIDDMRLIRQLRKTHPANILREAGTYSSLSRANAVAAIIATYYNKNLRLSGSTILDVNRLYV